MSVPPTTPSPWPRRFAFAAAACAVPLFAFGGSVTTLEAGMAVEGWWNAEGHFLPLFPVEKWFRDPETFVEHTHRLFGMLVGLLSIAMVVATFRCDPRPRAKVLASAALLAVCAQGTLGGFRVLENAPRLAFLHGVLGQAVFALLVGTAAYLSRGWIDARASKQERASSARGLTLAALLGCFAQVALGAWYRHGLRPTPVADASTRFELHLVGALVLFLLIAAASTALAKADSAPLRRIARGLRVLLGVQLVLGIAAFAANAPEGVTAAELVLSVAHVVGGALLLAWCALGAMWARRALLPGAPEASPAANPCGGGAS